MLTTTNIVSSNPLKSLKQTQPSDLKSFQNNIVTFYIYDPEIKFIANKDTHMHTFKK